MTLNITSLNIKYAGHNKMELLQQVIVYITHAKTQGNSRNDTMGVVYESYTHYKINCNNKRYLIFL